MDRAPLPPHERPWRHPSELGPPAHEPTSTSGRVLIATTATLSLLLIGLLALSMTPDRGPSPAAVQATSAGASTGPVAFERPALPMVTPLGDDGWGVTTSGAAGIRARSMTARLPSGLVVEVDIVRRDAESGVTLVSLPEETHGYQLATESPAPDDTVVVHGAEPQVVAMVDISGLDVVEGTPVLDDAGALVGICTTDADGVAVMTVSTMPGTPTATTSTMPRPTTTTATTVPTTTSGPSPATPPPSATTPTPTTQPTATLPATASTGPSPVTTTPTPGVSGGDASTTAPG